MRYFLIDLENVHDMGIEGADLLDENNCVIIFYSSAASSISSASLDLLLKGKAAVQFESVSERTKNALDFELAVCAGKLMTKEDTDQMVIISDDNGYRAVIEAGEKLKHGLIVQYHSILTAWYHCIRPDRIRVKNEIVGMNEVRKKIRRKQKYYVEAVQHAVDPQIYVNVIQGSEGDKKLLYQNMLHEFGREKGLELYQHLKNGYA